VADVSRLPGPVDDHWRWQARACRGLQTTTFFHPDFERGENRSRRVAQAKAVCHRCPVLAWCREHALQVQEPYGIGGGLSEEERESALRAERRTGSMPAALPSTACHDVHAP
jgi:WhiB family redox-sensing transcriptional regulator